MSPNTAQDIVEETSNELILQRGKMTTQRWEIQQRDGVLITLLIAIMNQDGSCWTIRATKLVSRDGSPTEAKFTVEDEDHQVVLFTVDKLTKMTEFVSYCFAYRPDRMSPYEWEHLVGGINKTHTEVVRAMTVVGR